MSNETPSRKQETAMRPILKWLGGHAYDAAKLLVGGLVGYLLSWYFAYVPHLVFGVTQPFQ